MPWGRYESSFTRHPKVQQIPRDRRPEAIALHLAATLYAAELLTDGIVPEDVLPHLALEVGISLNDANVTLLVTRDALVKVGLFDKVKGGYQVHDYLDYNPSADDVKESRRQAAERQRKRRNQLTLPDSHGVTDPVTNAVTDTVTVTGEPRARSRPRVRRARPGPKERDTPSVSLSTTPAATPQQAASPPGRTHNEQGMTPDPIGVSGPGLKSRYTPDHGDRYAHHVLWMIHPNERAADLRYQFPDIPDEEIHRLVDLAADLEAQKGGRA